jgi:hypothetical protein
VANLLRVAARSGDRCAAHLDELAGRVLKAAHAPFAHRERDLVTGATVVRRSAERRARQEEQRGVVVQRLIALLPNAGHGLAKRG